MPEREVERQRAGRDRADRDVRLVAHLHDGALAEVPLDLPEGGVQSLLAIHLHQPPSVLAALEYDRFENLVLRPTGPQP